MIGEGVQILIARVGLGPTARRRSLGDLLTVFRAPICYLRFDRVRARTDSGLFLTDDALDASEH
jgi:hypothetical protein